MKTWQLQTAKAHLSEVIKNAVSQGPQSITLRGEPTAVVISQATFNKLTKKAKTVSLVEFMRQSPLVGIQIDLTRNSSTTRDIEI